MVFSGQIFENVVCRMSYVIDSVLLNHRFNNSKYNSSVTLVSMLYDVCH